MQKRLADDRWWRMSRYLFLSDLCRLSYQQSVLLWKKTSLLLQNLLDNVYLCGAILACCCKCFLILDINECDEQDKCDAGKYCLNNPGSYKCESMWTNINNSSWYLFTFFISLFYYRAQNCNRYFFGLETKIYSLKS